MTVRAILDLKGRDVTTIAPERTLGEAARLLSENKIGALVVIGADRRVSGILSERDIVKSVSRIGAGALEIPITDVMTREVIVCGPHDTVAHLMNRMTAGRFRHLPVVEEGRLAGIISIGDVVKYRLHEMESEQEALRDYIQTA